MHIEVAASRVANCGEDELYEPGGLAAIDDFIDELGLTDKQARSLDLNGS